MAGASPNPIATLEFERDLDRLRAEIGNPAVFNRDTCAEYISRNTGFLIERGAESYRPRTVAELQRLRDQGPWILRDMFGLRLSLADHLQVFHQAGPVDSACIAAVRRAFRYSRFVEELIAEFLVNGNQKDLPTKPLQGIAPSLMLNPAYAMLELRSGDLLLVRSPSFISAAIARIGDEDGQFSHLAMVYVADDGSRYVMEALIESGVVTVPLDQWLVEERDRLLVLRHREQHLAAKAARDLHAWIESRRSTGEIIPYDYEMNLADHSELFCAELIGFSYELGASEGPAFPAYPTSLEALQGHPFLDDMGIRALVTFAPGDAEVDPRLELVAEWRDLRRTAESRIEDAILTSILEWMSSRNYQLTHRGLFWVDFYWTLLRPLGVWEDKLPGNANKAFVKSVLALESVAKLIYEKIAPPLHAAVRQNPLALDYKAILKAVEAYRLRDCERLITYRHWRRENPVYTEGDNEPAFPELHYLIHAPAGDTCQ